MLAYGITFLHNYCDFYGGLSMFWFSQNSICNIFVKIINVMDTFKTVGALIIANETCTFKQ